MSLTLGTRPAIALSWPNIVERVVFAGQCLAAHR
jgi:hypothetical protein